MRAEIPPTQAAELAGDLLQSAAVFFVAIDPDGKTATMNAAMLEALGYAPDEVVGTDYLSTFVPKSDRARVARVLEFRRTSRGPSVVENRVLTRDGRELIVEWHGRAVFRPDGELDHYVAIGIDRTERLRAEQQLREREQEYRAIFEGTMDGIIINDLETGIVVEANPAACRMHGYTYEEFVGLHPTQFIHPDYHHLFGAFLETLRAGGSMHVRAVDLRKDGTPFYIGARGTIFTYQGKPHILSVIRDITELEEARQLLEQRVAERTRELSTLLKISHNVASTVELKPLLNLILDQLKAVVDYHGSSIMALDVDKQDLEIIAASGVNEGLTRALGLRFPLAVGGAIWERINHREPVIIDDVRGEDELARAYQAALGERLYAPPFSFVRSWLVAPLALEDRLIGMLTVSRRQPGAFTPHHASLVMAVANQAAVAIENASLRAQAEQRLRNLEALYRADEELYRSLRLDDVLRALVDVATDILEADKTAVLVWDPRRERLVMGATHGFRPETVERVSFAPGEGLVGCSAVSREVLATEDAPADTRIPPRIGELIGPEAIRAEITAPIVVDDEVFAVFSVNYCQPRPLGSEEKRLLHALAQRAALAIENARLYEQAQQAATLEERQRLARELHDSVSQALYGIALGTRTARTLLDRDPSKVADPLDYVLSLAEAGLAEMRALIFELRPESLETEGLVAALAKQADALRARHRIVVDATLGDEPDAPLPVKEALYRIAQEALHNAVKHARATALAVRLERRDDSLVLEVGDNGVGFDPGGEFPGHLGLRSMRERAAALGGALEIDSAPGRGACIRARLPAE